MYNEITYYKFNDGNGSTLVHDYSDEPTRNHAKIEGSQSFNDDGLKCEDSILTADAFGMSESWRMILSFIPNASGTYYINVGDKTASFVSNGEDMVNVYIDTDKGIYIGGTQEYDGEIEDANGVTISNIDGNILHISEEEDDVSIEAKDITLSAILWFGDRHFWRSGTMYDGEDVLKAYQWPIDSDLQYYVNGVNFREYGVEVSASAGIVGSLARKNVLTHEWADRHGKSRQHSLGYLKERTIKLTCFIDSNRADYVGKVNDFLDAFNVDNGSQLRIEYNGEDKPLVYNVYLEKETDPNKKWGYSIGSNMVATFTLELVEYEPVKKILLHVGEGRTAEITFKTYDPVNIYWGDGTFSGLIGGDGNTSTITHTYNDSAMSHYIIMACDTTEMYNLSTDCAIVWNDLR